ncbi:MAG TPA: PASTA domain-containing protein [Terriglobales bacterium]|nr:PASTA domain-containing protein [Terriglobales bacterium]
MRHFFRIALRVLILTAVFLASTLTAMRFAIHGREVAVPKLDGMSTGQAERTTNNNGLLIEVENRFFSSTVPEGRVISQLPPAGEKVRRGTRVRVALSLGAQKMLIPNVVGQSQRAAELNIARRGLELGTVAVATLPGYPAEQVLAQSPPASAEGIASPKVNLLVSAPDPNAELYITPDFVGHTLDEASRAIAESPMRFGKVTTVKNGGRMGAHAPTSPQMAKTASPGKSPLIVKQNPPAGDKVPAGSMISFEVVR